MKHQRFLLAGILLSICGPLHAKMLPPCAAQIKCEVAGDQVRCSPELLTPRVCEVAAVEVAISWEAVRPLALDPSPRLESETVGLESQRWSRFAPGSPAAPVFERVLASPAESRVRRVVREAATGKFLSSALAYLVRDGDRYVSATDHPVIQSRPVLVHHVQFDGARRW